jgi:hypothetical protein
VVRILGLPDLGDHARFDLYLLVSQSDGGAADKPPSTRI